MGLILDSSVAIAAERRGDTVQAFLQRVVDAASDHEAALPTVGVVELVHGIHRRTRLSGVRVVKHSSRIFWRSSLCIR